MPLLNTSRILILFLSTILFGSSPGQGQELSATYLEVSLPSPTYCHSAVYDGGDLIYLIGNCLPPTFRTSISVFSISMETMEVLGPLPGDAEFTTAVQSEGNIFIFGGGTWADKVYSYDPSTNLTSVAVDSLQFYPALHPSFKVNSTTLLLLATSDDTTESELWTFDLTSMASARRVGTFPFRTRAATSAEVGGGIGYVFSGAWTVPDNRQTLELNLETLEVRRVGPPTFPPFYYSASIWDGGEYVYILGGYNNVQGHPTEGLFQFNTNTFENELGSRVQ